LDFFPSPTHSAQKSKNEEANDIILATITFLQLQEIPTDVILENFNLALKKIEKRVRIIK